MVVVAICIQSLSTIMVLEKLSVQELQNHAIKTELKILVVGKPGIGKRTLLTALFGEGKDCGAMMCDKLFVINGVAIQVTLVDSPNSVHLVQELDMAIVAMRMDDTRYRGDDQLMLEALSHKFGSTVWNKCLIALTFANRVTYVDPVTGKEQHSIEYSTRKAIHWVDSVHRTLKARGTEKTVLRHLPFIPVGHSSKLQLYDNTESWKASLVKCMIVRLKESGLDASAAMWRAMEDTISGDASFSCKSV